MQKLLLGNTPTAITTNFLVNMKNHVWDVETITTSFLVLSKCEKSYMRCGTKHATNNQGLRKDGLQP